MEQKNLLTQLAKIKLLVFDIDGVLVDVSDSYRKAIKETVEFFYKKEIHPDEIQELKNETGFNNDWDLTQELLKRKGKILSREKIINKFQSIYWGTNGNGLIEDETWLLDHKILKTISKKYLLAIFTGRPRLEAEFVLSINKVISYFNPIIAMEDVKIGKPNPEGLINICNTLSIKPEEVCYLGDTFDDVRSAKSANIIPIAIIPPMGKDDLYDVFLELGAYAVFKNINIFFEQQIL